ncbi:Hypothetical protein (Fragment), partial [Durusdinium trenchii]
MPASSTPEHLCVLGANYASLTHTHRIRLRILRTEVGLVAKKWMLGDQAGLKMQVYQADRHMGGFAWDMGKTSAIRGASVGDSEWLVWSKWALKRAESEKKLASVHMSLAKWARGDAKGILTTVFVNWKQDALTAAGDRKMEAALDAEKAKMERLFEEERRRAAAQTRPSRPPVGIQRTGEDGRKVRVPVRDRVKRTETSAYLYSQVYAAKRSDYYLRRGHAFDWDEHECHAFLDAAVEISSSNASVLERAEARGCNFQASASSSSVPTELQIGPVRRWRSARSAAPSSVGQSRDLFATPLGFLHVSELGLRDWQKTLEIFGTAAIAQFQKVQKAERRRSFVDLNNHFFQSQDTNPRSAMAEPHSWRELYSSKEYREWAKVSQQICSSFINKLGIPLAEEEAKNLELVTWAAVYPKSHEPVTHYYHAHQESIVSFVLYVKMPEPVTPLTISDPRGAPPVEDFEWFQDLGDMGVDGDPPFHRPVEFYPEEGDILIFPSFAIHKVPPHLGEDTRVVFPSNCHLPKKPKVLDKTFHGMENPLDGWERIARWQAPYLSRPWAVSRYRHHANLALAAAERLEDPYMKIWEVQNQVLAMLQFGLHDPRAWLQAGNLSAKAAVILDSRGEGEYYLDASLMFARALDLDPSIKQEVDSCLDAMIPRKVKKKQKEAYGSLAKWRKLIKSWRTEPPRAEVTQFLHPEVNGPGRCSRMCPASQMPTFRTLRIRSVFSSRIYILKGRELTVAVKAAEELLEAELGFPVQVEASEELEDAGWIERHTSVNARVVLCASTPVLLADPRGRWPRHWPGSVQDTGEEPKEPKAPFHWHLEVPCDEGQLLLLPAWLPLNATGAAGRYAPVRNLASPGKAPIARRNLPVKVNGSALTATTTTGRPLGCHWPRPSLEAEGGPPHAEALKEKARQSVLASVEKWALGNDKGAAKAALGAWSQFTKKAKSADRQRQAVRASLMAAFMSKEKAAVMNTFKNWQTLTRSEKAEREREQILANEQNHWKAEQDRLRDQFDKELRGSLTEQEKLKAAAQAQTELALRKWLSMNETDISEYFIMWRRLAAAMKDSNRKRAGVKDAMTRFLEGERRGVMHSVFTSWKTFVTKDAKHQKEVKKLQQQVENLLRKQEQSMMKYGTFLASKSGPAMKGAVFRQWFELSQGVKAAELEREREVELEDMRMKHKMEETRKKEVRAKALHNLGAKGGRAVLMEVFLAWSYLYQKNKELRFHKMNENKALVKYSEYVLGKKMRQDSHSLMAFTFSEWRREGKILRHQDAMSTLEERDVYIAQLRAGFEEQLALAYQQIDQITETLQKELQTKEELAQELREAYEKNRKINLPEHPATPGGSATPGSTRRRQASAEQRGSSVGSVTRPARNSTPGMGMSRARNWETEAERAEPLAVHRRFNGSTSRSNSPPARQDVNWAAVVDRLEDRGVVS